MASLSAAEHYPDPECRKLKQALARRHGIKRESLICGNGGAELIYRLAYALRPKKALLTAPTFAEYEEALRQTDTECIFYEMQPDLQIREDILDEMDSSLDVMFVCNPNNPTGILTPRSLLEQILKKADVCGILLVLDECFLDFLPEGEGLSAKHLLKKLDRDHQDYYHFFTGRKWGNASNYDLCLNSAAYGIDGSVDFILRMLDREGRLNFPQ